MNDFKCHFEGGTKLGLFPKFPKGFFRGGFGGVPHVKRPPVAITTSPNHH